jgi:hypothetical protein
MAHEIDARNALDDAVICNGIFTKEVRAEAESLGRALVICGLVAKVLEVVVPHQLVLGLWGGARRRGRVVFVCFGIVIGWSGGRLSLEARIAFRIPDIIRQAHAFPLSFLRQHNATQRKREGLCQYWNTHMSSSQARSRLTPHLSNLFIVAIPVIDTPRAFPRGLSLEGISSPSWHF